MLILLQDEVIQLDDIVFLFNNINYMGVAGWTQCTYRVSELICSTINANYEISTVNSMEAWLECIRAS